MLCSLSDFRHIRPRHEIEQEKSLDWIAVLHARAEHPDAENSHVFRKEIRDKLVRIGLGKEKIANRGIQICDMFEEDWTKMEVYPVLEEKKGKGFTLRSQVYDREASQIFEEFYPEGALLPGHLIHVTCTGYVSPSPAQRLVSVRNGGAGTTVTHAYHMGCYGSIPAIRMGAGFSCLPSPASGVDIVHTELCCLHIHPMSHRSEQLLVESLFADGFIKYTVGQRANGPHLKVHALHEEMVPESLDAMTWSCGDNGLIMTLAKTVPVLITRSLPGYLERLSHLAGEKKDTVVRNALFAIHPGGPKILQQIKELLQLEDYQLEHSLAVLKEYGNMSSATLPHIWEKMLNDPQVEPGTPIVSMAFGPGLNVAGGLFEKGN